MAEKQDIAMNEFPINNVADYLYTEKGNNQQKVTPTDLVKSCGFFIFNKVFAPGEQYELPYSSGLIMIQNSTQTHDKAVATLCGNGSGTVIVPSSVINFFSEVSGKVCVFNTGTNTKYVVKNKKESSANVILTFIG